jgi:hypothetical protein
MGHLGFTSSCDKTASVRPLSRLLAMLQRNCFPPIPGRHLLLYLSRYCLLLCLATSLAAATTVKKPKKRSTESAQMQPSPDRVLEIQAALRAHGYDPGTTWEETQEACRKIADQHMWQTDHAPDARVLILLGLGGPHSDPAVTQLTGDRLDQDQRSEAARHAQNPAEYAATSSPEHRPEPDTPAAHAATSKPAATHASGPTRRQTTAKAAANSVSKVQKKKASSKRSVRKPRPKPALASRPQSATATQQGRAS